MSPRTASPAGTVNTVSLTRDRAYVAADLCFSLVRQVAFSQEATALNGLGPSVGRRKSQVS